LVVNRSLGQFHGIKAEIVNHQVWGVSANALVIYLPRLTGVLSGRQGYKRVNAVCNLYIPQPLWPRLHRGTTNWSGYFGEVLKGAINTLELPLGRVAVLSTGVDMNQLAWAEESADDDWALAFVTAGVSSNAIRLGQEKNGVARGGHKPGTINTVLLCSTTLSQAALAACFITITEAKVVALEELDIKSSYTPELRATGTGTDQIVAVSGSGRRISYVGGHTLLGELIAKAVTRATIAAIKNRWATTGERA
jgi:adenosylcobinamide amidohydrolase